MNPKVAHSAGHGHSTRSWRYQSLSLHSRQGRSHVLESQSSSRTVDIDGEKTRIRGRSPRHDNRAPKRRDKSTIQKIKDLNAQINAINPGANASVTIEVLVRQTEPPFTYRVMKVKMSSRFNLPFQLEVYEGKTDPMDHLDSYKNLMSL
ncbi:hypothetical protein Acr_05g0000680 [Actinidia rufa]|uniref:Uncharacterized protein n=1 Tax=Actinidia rufa TaxID=165716 RepID=A0A7J0EKI3_9ERIC|nr:hypothetical protein Acr_05g0000680 [Actinidia rufa]